MLRANEIQDLLSEHYPGLSFLEVASSVTKRYRDKHTILFEYANLAGNLCVLKFISLQHIVECDRKEEKNELVKGYKIIRQFDDHPNVIRIYKIEDLFLDGRLIGFFITMEKFGNTLATLLQKRETLPESIVLSFLKQMDKILHKAHRELGEPILHSDIKPQNIGLRTGKNGETIFVLMDFNLNGIYLKTDIHGYYFAVTDRASIDNIHFIYAAPEQVLAYLYRSGKITTRVDLYAAGIIAIQMLTGKIPEKKGNNMDYRLPLADIPENFRNVFNLLCAKKDADRPERIESAINQSQKNDTPSSQKPKENSVRQIKSIEEFAPLPVFETERVSHSSSFFDNFSPKILLGNIVALFLILLSIFIYFAEFGSPVPESSSFRCGKNSVTDINGNRYRTVQVGNQCWMAENLRTKNYQSGERILYISDENRWTNQFTGAWSYYDNNPRNESNLGYLYNWYAVNDRRGLCPKNWRVPSDSDWIILEKHLGVSQKLIHERDRRDCNANAGGKLKDTGTNFWNAPNTRATNETGFSARAGGHRNSNGNFYHIGNFGDYWSSTSYTFNLAWSRRLGHNSENISRLNFFKQSGFSVRCIRETEIQD